MTWVLGTYPPNPQHGYGLDMGNLHQTPTHTRATHTHIPVTCTIASWKSGILLRLAFRPSRSCVWLGRTWHRLRIICTSINLRYFRWAILSVIWCVSISTATIHATDRHVSLSRCSFKTNTTIKPTISVQSWVFVQDEQVRWQLFWLERHPALINDGLWTAILTRKVHHATSLQAICSIADTWGVQVRLVYTS